jgi:hypothetical protein
MDKLVLGNVMLARRGSVAINFNPPETVGQVEC